MPTYDYRCERTGEMFEMWQSFAEDTLTVCPRTHDGDTDVCGAEVKKVFSKVGIAFKGDGFYKNDHGSSSQRSSTESSGSESSGSESSGSSASTTSASTTATKASNTSSSSSSAD
ncbi:MAG: FmdB family zinc ribbon protein [Acidimicrobiales bacterium]